MGEVIPFRRRLSPEAEASAIQRLADLDMKIEPLQREAEQLRRSLGLLAIERGVADGYEV